MEKNETAHRTPSDPAAITAYLDRLYTDYLAGMKEQAEGGWKHGEIIAVYDDGSCDIWVKI